MNRGYTPAGPASAGSPLLVCAQALGVIYGEGMLGIQQRLEFGGSLLAAPLEPGGPLVVAYALPTGDGAGQQHSHLVTDHHFQNRALAAIAAHYPRLDYVGDWHVHPMFMPRLSSTDLNTCAQILADPEYGLNALTLLLATLDHSGAFSLLGFRVTPHSRHTAPPWQSRHDHPQVEEIAFTPVADNDPRVVQALGGPVLPLDRLLNGGAPTLPAAAPSSNTTSQPSNLALVSADDREVEPLEAEPLVPNRINDDLDRLRNLGWEGELRTTDSQLLHLTLEREGRTLFLALPPEYPISPPKPFWLEHGELMPAYCAVLNWSSLCGLEELVTLLADQKELEAELEAQYRLNPPIVGEHLEADEVAP